MGKRLFLDMDGTVARFHDSILDAEGHVQIELMYEKDFFRKLEPFQNMIDAMKLFIKNHPECEVYSLSAAQLGDPPGFVRQKDEWLDEFLPEIDRAHRIYPECGKVKSDYIPGGVSIVDYLLDDFNKNLREWVRDGGKSIKCKNNINHKGLGKFGGSVGNLWTGDMVSNLDKPEEILRQMEDFMDLEHVQVKSSPIEDFDMLPLEEEQGYTEKAISLVEGKEMLMITATPLKDNYPAVEIDISKRDLDRILKEVYKGDEEWSIENFLMEYTWDDGDVIKDFIEVHPEFCQDICKITDFAKAKYSVIITNCWEHDVVGIYNESLKGLYPEVIDEVFMKGLLEKGFEGSRILVTDINSPTWDNVIFDGVVDAHVFDEFKKVVKERKKGFSLDDKLRNASTRCGGSCGRSEREMEM